MCFPFSPRKTQHINKFDPHLFPGQSREVVYVYCFPPPPPPTTKGAACAKQTLLQINGFPSAVVTRHPLGLGKSVQSQPGLSSRKSHLQVQIPQGRPLASASGSGQAIDLCFERSPLKNMAKASFSAYALVKNALKIGEKVHFSTKKSTSFGLPFCFFPFPFFASKWLKYAVFFCLVKSQKGRQKTRPPQKIYKGSLGLPQSWGNGLEP